MIGNEWGVSLMVLLLLGVVIVDGRLRRKSEEARREMKKLQERAELERIAGHQIDWKD